MYNPIKSSFLDKVPAARVHQEKTTESNIKSVHTLKKRKDFVVETFVKSETSSMMQNITVVNLEHKEFHDIDLQRNGEILNKELLNSKIRNAFAIFKPSSKVLPFNSQTDPSINIPEKTNLPVSRYKRQGKTVCNQNSPILNKKQEPEKYQRDRQRIAQRPISQPAKTKIEKYIEEFETNGYFSRRKSEEDTQIFNPSLKGQNPRKYKRQQERFVERPYSQTSWEEIEKHIKSFELRNKNLYFHQPRESNFSPSGREEDLENPKRQQIQILEKSHSKRPQNKIEKNSVELHKDSYIKQSCKDIWVKDPNSSLPLGEKKHGKYKRSEHRLQERPSSQPSKIETEKFLTITHKQKNSLHLESQEDGSIRNGDGNLTPFTKEKNPEKYRRKSQFKERPSSEILGSRIREYIEILESKTKRFHQLNFEQLGTEEQDPNNCESKTNSIKYERHRPNSACKPDFKISRTGLRNSEESCEIDGKSFVHQSEKFANQSLSEPLNAKIKKTELKYSRSNQKNNRSISAPTVFIQTNVPNYFEYSRVDNSGYGSLRKKQNHIKEAGETEEECAVESKHDILRGKLTSLLMGQRLKSPDLTISDQSLLKNGHSVRRNKDSRADISDFLYLQSIFNRRPNKKVSEDGSDYSNLKKNKDCQSERCSPIITQQHQKERLHRNHSTKSLVKNNISDLENTQTELDYSRNTGQTFTGYKSENPPKANEFNQETNQLQLNNVQTNAPLYYLKLPHEKKRHSIKGKELKESSKLIDSCKGNMSINSSIDSLSSSHRPENEIPAESKYTSLQRKDKRNSGHHTKDERNSEHHTKDEINSGHHTKDEINSGHHTKDEINSEHHTKDEINSEHHTINERNSGHHTKDERNSEHHTKNERNSGHLNKDERTSGHFTKDERTSELFTKEERNSGHLSNDERDSGQLPKEERTSGHLTKNERNSGHLTKNERTSGHFTKDERNSGLFTKEERNSGHLTKNDRNSGHFTKEERTSGHLPEEERNSGHLTKNENNSGHISKNGRHTGHLTKDSVQEENYKDHSQPKKNKSFYKYYHSENNINSHEPNSSELDSHEPDSSPSHSLDKDISLKVPESKENHSVNKTPENLISSTEIKLNLFRVKNGQKQSSENEMGPAKLDWSISEISIPENEVETEELTRSQVNGSTLLYTSENDTSYAPHDLEVSKKRSSGSLSRFSKGHKRSFSSSQLSKNSFRIKKKLEFCSTEDEIESVKCHFRLQKYFSLWKKEWHKHLAAKTLWKRHSLQKGINALRQATQNSQLVSGVLQERIKKIWLKSCFQKWKKETNIKLNDQLAEAFQKWKENAKEQKRFRILKQIHHRNILLLCFQKWRSHYKSKIMFLRALMHNKSTLLYSVWHQWMIFVKQNQQKKFWQVMARKYQRKKLLSRTLKGLVTAYRNSIKAKSHYRFQKLKMVLYFWRRGAAISSYQSEEIVAAVQQCSNQLILRRTLDIWVNQLWLICESRRADRWILSRYLGIWYRKWCCIIAWRQTVVAKIEHQHTHAVIHKWRQNVQLQKQYHQLASRCIQKVLLIQLLTKWRRIAKRQIELRIHLQTQLTKGQCRIKVQVLSIWKNKLCTKQKARQVYYLWSEQCVRKAVNRWKDSHHQAILNKRALMFEPMRNVLIQKEIFLKWKLAWQKANKEKEEAHRCHVILQQKLLGALFHKWHSRTRGTLAAKPLIQRQNSQLLLRIIRAWHCFLWKKHQRTKKSLQLQNYHLKQLFHKWRNLFNLREKEKKLQVFHCRQLLSKCVLGWQLVVQRKTRAIHFHQGMLLRKFFFWKERTTRSLRCKAMKEAEKRSCQTVQHYFFNRWKQNAIQQKIHRIESTRHIENLHKQNVLTQALTSWKHLLKIHIIARNHYKHRLVILMRQVLIKWHWFTESTSCLAVRCLQRSLHIDTWMECPHIGRHHGCHWQEDEVLQKELNERNDSTTDETCQAIETDENDLELIALRNQKVMTRMILQLKYWPMGIAFLQWRHYTERCHQLKTVRKQLHIKHIMVILSTTFGLWKQQQQATKLARCHQEHKLMKRTFREIQKYAVCRRSKKDLLSKARNHHCLFVFKTCFPIWQKKVKEKQYWDKVAKLLSHSSPEEQLLQPTELQLTSLLGQRSLRTCFHIWQKTYQEASFYRQQYHRMLLVRYFKIWRSWAMYRQHLTQKCNVFRKKRIQSLALQVWICRVHQNKWMKKTQGQKVNCLLQTILRQWHQWASKCSKQKASKAKVQQNHGTVMLSQVFNSMTKEFNKINKAHKWYQNQLIRKVIIAWSYRSHFQIQERAKMNKFQLKKNKAMMKKVLHIWKHAYQVKCEAKFNREQRIHLKVCCIAMHWKKKAKKTRGKILETVFTDRMVHSCFSLWKNRFDMMKQLEGQLHLFVLWKQQQTQKHLFARWKSTLLVTRADLSFKNKLLFKVLKGWQKWTRASLLYQRQLQEYQNFMQKRQLESTFRIWKIGWKYKRTSTKLFKQNIQSRAFKAWYTYVQGQIRLKILQAYLEKRLSAQHLLSTYSKWKGMFTARTNERRKEKEQAVKAERHYKTRLSLVFFQAWLQETVVSRCIVRHQMNLAYKYCSRWKYYTDLSYTAVIWSEKQSYHRVWCKWRAAFIREKTATIMEAEFRQQNIRQIFRIWYQYCRYKKIHEKESLFPGICLNLANI